MPKPLVEIDNFPILFHIMNTFAIQGVRDFIILTGYKGHLVSDFFMNLRSRNGDFEIDLKDGSVRYLSEIQMDWKVTVLDTGISTMTGGRLLRARNLLSSDKVFYFTYGDGLANVNLNSLLTLHQNLGTIATVTAVLPPSRFGKIKFSNSLAHEFSEKPLSQDDRINGGFFALTPKIFDYLTDDSCVFEEEPLSQLARDSELSVYSHNGYWRCMDTLRDLEQIRSDASTVPVPWLCAEGGKWI